MQQDQKINQFRCPLNNKLSIQSSFFESGVISRKKCVPFTSTVLLRGVSSQLHYHYVTKMNTTYVFHEATCEQVLCILVLKVSFIRVCTFKQNTHHFFNTWRLTEKEASDLFLQ